ncbi:MAG: ABC transporter ATP-binding protein [Micromonosporaceae bacterium]|jgi:branched-chain amino acid transport system ATP-binding protein
MLEIRDVHAGYATASVLRGVSLTVSAGETVALLGRNGMGKSTLVRVVCGLTPPVLTAGSVALDGERIDHLPSYAVARRGIGLVPQGRRIFGSLTVEENLRVVPDRGGGTWSLDAVYHLFPRLRERRRQRGATLSGGEQQMLAIGRALMTNPRLLIMDEPSEGLAPTVLDVLRERLRELRGTGQALLIAEQNVDLALDLADRVAILGAAGTMVWQGTAGQLRADPAPIHEHLGL